MSRQTDNNILLSVRDLRIWFGQQSPVRAVDGVSFDIRRGETFALLGESGCGKSMTAMAVMQLLPDAARIRGGEVIFDDHDLLHFSELQMRQVRGNRIAMIFQEPMTSLNPVMTVAEQIGEVLVQHQQMKGQQVTDEVLHLLQAVGIPEPEQRMRDYPHQLSGGMKQRVMIAIALAAKPDLLIADEPTTALDVTIQAQVLDLLKQIQQDTGMAIMLITHDLGVVADKADHIAVMYAGEIVEVADRDTFMHCARHPYTRKLFAALPNRQKRNQWLEVIKGSVPALNQEFRGCRFAQRCEFADASCENAAPGLQQLNEQHLIRCIHHDVDSVQTESAMRRNIEQTENQVIMSSRELCVHFPIHKGLFHRTVGHVYAVDGVDIQLHTGRTLALVGESGCGKTTVGKAMLQLIQPTSGEVKLDGQQINGLPSSALRTLRRRMQIIFQDPFSSMNPRMQVGRILEEGMLAQGLYPDALQREQRVTELLEQVGLPAESRLRYPHEFSGGQRQRICIARALSVEPAVIVCDEPTSALDVSVQAQTLNLLRQLQEQLGLSYLFITHNISVVDYMAHEVAVMYLGRIVEQGTVQSVLDNPLHPYTQALLSAVPVVDQQHQREVIKLEGEPPSPVSPPAGCHFHLRCPHVKPECKNQYPQRHDKTEMHWVKCHLYQ